MKNEELIKYLEGFPLEAGVAVLVVDVNNRIHYEVDNLIAITGADYPMFGIELGKSEPFDDEMNEAVDGEEN